MRRFLHLHGDPVRSVWNHGLLRPIHGRFLDIGFTLNLKEERVARSSDFALRSDYLTGIYSPGKNPHLFRNQSRYREINKRAYPVSPRMGNPGRDRPCSYGRNIGSCYGNPGFAPRNLPPKGKGKENKTNTVTKIQARNEHSTSNDNGEAGRRVELLKWQPTPQALADMRKRYGDAQSFLSIFTPRSTDRRRPSPGADPIRARPLRWPR